MLLRGFLQGFGFALGERCACHVLSWWRDRRTIDAYRKWMMQ